MKPGKLYKIIGNRSISIANKPFKRVLRSYRPGERVNIDHSCSWLDHNSIVVLLRESQGECQVLLGDQICYFNKPIDGIVTPHLVAFKFLLLTLNSADMLATN